MATTEEQKKQKGYAEVTYGAGPLAQTVKVWGTIGTLEFLGMTPSLSGLLSANGVDKVVSRKTHKRSRWLGDRIGTSVDENNAGYSLYPSRRGTALPGTPIKIINLDEKLQSGGHPRYTVQVDGNMGTFIGWYTDKTHTFRSRIVGKTGALYEGLVEKSPVTPP